LSRTYSKASGSELLQRQFTRYTEDLKANRQSRAEINSATFKKTKKLLSASGGGKPSLMSIFSQIDEDLKSSSVTKSDETFDASACTTDEAFLSASHELIKSGNKCSVALMCQFMGSQCVSYYFLNDRFFINVVFYYLWV
jgi:hypothetical protein